MRMMPMPVSSLDHSLPVIVWPLLLYGTFQDVPMSASRSGVPGPGEMTMLWNSPASSRGLRASHDISSLRMTVGSTEDIHGGMDGGAKRYMSDRKNIWCLSDDAPSG